MTRARRLATISVIGLGIALIAGACSSDSGDGAASTTASPVSLPSEVQAQLQKVLDDARAEFIRLRVIENR